MLGRNIVEVCFGRRSRRECEFATHRHDVEVCPDIVSRAGAICAVQVDPDTGLRHAGADPRREAYAIAW